MYNSLSEKSRSLTTLNPFNKIMIHTTENTPPITAEGIELITAESLPKNDNPINQNEAITNTFLLATPVIEIIPALVEYPVTGVAPTKAAAKHPIPSPITPLLT